MKDELVTSDYIDHDPIVVDSDYLENNCSGTGTAEDPYVIENLRIEYNQSCITVRDLDYTTSWGNGTSITTFRHLVIRNCWFIGIPMYYTEIDVDLRGTGVRIEYNAHNVSVINNRFEKLYKGVYIFHNANNNLIKGNYFNCSYGIRVEDSSYENIFCDNRFVGGPEHPRPATYGNGQHGVGISLSAGNLIVNNTFSGLDSGVDLWARSVNNTIINNTITDSFYVGVVLSEANSTVVANNTCMYNFYFGIWIDELSTNCTIVNNTLAYNGHGFEIPVANTTAFSLAATEPGRGICITRGSSGNEIKFNDLIYNQENTLDEVPGNIYDYNYWTDYTGTDSNNDDIGDTPYYVAGVGGGIDTHPSMIPWSPVPPVRPTPNTSPSPTQTEGVANPLVTYMVVGFGLTIAAIVVIIVLKQRTS